VKRSRKKFFKVLSVVQCWPARAEDIYSLKRINGMMKLGFGIVLLYPSVSRSVSHGGRIPEKEM
jgi:hypothetical protein